jgi:glycosyltransferase involved in cell wall biosynthesis
MTSTESKTNVLLVGDYDYTYPREHEIHDGLTLNGATVHEIKFRDEPLFIGPKKILLLLYYYLLLSLRIARVSLSTDVDAIVLTKFNPTMIPIVWLWSQLLGAVFVYDLFVSLYRTAELRDINPLLVRTIYYIERLTLSLPDYHLTETEQFADLYAELYNLPRDRIIPLPVGVDEEWFSPRDGRDTEAFTVVYWGNFLPHHGLDPIVEAASELDGTDIEFVFLGEGPEQDRIVAATESLGLSNVRFLGRVPMDDLVDWVAGADVCLGIFSSDIRARASITNKVSEGVAMGKPVVTMDSPAIRDWFTDRDNIFLVPPEDGQALANAIRTFRDDDALRTRMGENARARYEAVFSPENLGQIIAELVPLSHHHQ